MISNKKALFVLMTVLLSSFLYFPQAAFAEGDTVCSTRITGTTKVYNPNSGVVSFDAHPGPGVEDNQVIDLGVAAAGATGLAPANRSDAACANKEAGTAYGKNYEYALKGWAWDTNGGFVSMTCKSGANNAGGVDVPCGNFDYGVYATAADVNGNRNLFGFAWNQTLGWIRFDDDNPGDAYNYGVKIDVNGKTSGYAWTSAGVYIDFTNLTFNFGNVVVIPPSWCKDKTGLCAEISPDPSGLSFGASGDKGVKIADGKDGYNLNLYFKDTNGNGIDPNDTNPVNWMFMGKGIAPIDYYNFAKGIKFYWDDTIKLNQTADVKVGQTLNNVGAPFSNGSGAVTFKPLNFFDDFTQVYINGVKDPGHFVTKNPIASFAPTSESKLSVTTGTKPAYYTNNDNFIYKPDGETLPTELNHLYLNSISYPDLIDLDTGKVVLPSNVVYPSGKVNMPFKFRPAIYADTLYANDYQDNILGYRSVPVTVKRGLKQIGNLGNVSGSVEFHVGYSGAQTATQCSGQDTNFQFTAQDDANSGSTISNNSTGNVKILNVDINALIGKVFDFQFTPDIPINPNGASNPCAIAKGATVYSKILYSVGGQVVSYFDNKLPRTGGDSIVNPAVVVHGNIFAQAVGSVQGDQRVQSAGSVNVNLIRDAINENVQKYGGSTANIQPGSCALQALSSNGTYSDSPVCMFGKVLKFSVGNERVLYFKGGDVTLDFDSGDWGGRWVIVNDGGNIFVDKNLYPNDMTNSRISLIALRSADPTKYYPTGNVYLASTVTNLVATIVADGSFFSYDGVHADIDATSGEPKWADYSTMMKTLSSQLLIQGAIFSDNNIGGANLDQGTSPKQYLLAGGGRVIKLPASIQDRMKAQYYDLNYLRMFKLDLQISTGGLPIDQKCGKAWTPDDQANLIAGKAVCGEKQPCDPTGSVNQTNACDGINPLLKYDAQNVTGDLIVPSNITQAQGLDKNKNFDPVYVYYVSPDKDSFVFSKAGAINISGK